MVNRTLKKTAALGGVALAILFVWLSASFTEVRAAENTPTAEQILDKYVVATGGVAAYDKLKNSVSKATLDIPTAGVKIDITVYAERPNKFRSIAQSPAIGTNERGTDGKVYWEKSSMQGTKILEGQDLEDALHEAAFEHLAYWRSQNDSVGVAGVDTVAGSPCYKVVMKAKGGKPRTLFFDQKSGLITKTESIVTTPMGELQIESYDSDYRKVGDVLQPFKTTMTVMNTERIITVSSMEYNVSIPDTVFTLPASVKALLEKK